MSKFVIVKELPKTLGNNEFAIAAPQFLTEIRANARKKPKSGMLTVNYIREVIAMIGAKYVGETFNALGDVNISRYIGTPCKTEEEVHAIVLKIFKTQYPTMFNKYIDFHLKLRPRGTTLIYFDGAGDQVGAFLEMGFQQITPKELDNLVSDKPKKVVGKPAITDAQATGSATTEV